MNEKRIVCFLVLLISLQSWSQTYQKTQYGIKTKVKTTEIELQFYSPQIVRIIKLPSGAAASNKSLAVIASPQKLPLAVTTQNNELIVSSPSLQVKINR